MAFWALMLVALVCGAAWQATDRSREMTRIVRAALAAAQIPEKAAGDEIGLDRGEWSRQLNDQSPLSLSRLANLSDEFWRWFHLLAADTHGVVALKRDEFATAARDLVAAVGRPRVPLRAAMRTKVTA